MPCCLIASRFSIILILYFFRYRWSRWRSLLHGNSVQCVMVPAPNHLTGKNGTVFATFSFWRPAPVTPVFLPEKSQADCAVHATGSNECCFHQGVLLIDTRNRKILACFFFFISNNMSSSVLDTIYSPRASRVVPTTSQYSFPCCSQIPEPR